MRTTPFEDSEVFEATQAIFNDDAFVNGMQKYLPKDLVDYFLKAKDEVHSVYDFQSKMTAPFLLAIQKSSMTSRTVTGIENLNGRHLFICNHRDIVLDPCFVNMAFHENGIETCEVAIGSNLAKHQVTDYIFKLNRSFIVHREGNPRELYQHSLNLSNYIKDLIINDKASVWLAQREGRAKDGNDNTQQGLIKMLSMAKSGNLLEHFQSLNIIPITITYEFDPCDILKTQEFIEKQHNPNYKKTFEQDVQNMLFGITGDKGRTHFHFDTVLNDKLETLKTIRKPKEQLIAITKLLDKTIQQNFQLHEINYVAHDILADSDTYSKHYTKADYDKYQTNFESKLSIFDKNDYENAKQYLLGIYANPVKNKLKLS
ncbi:MAG: 1-acyl-sn-glycerol-3-phosphate acyltransferase [Saprospiraceae bacterium]